jgi:cellulose synthase/poly-beta-1,6-N-acetylglucosamine synthase-like glycosyltransferase
MSVVITVLYTVAALLAAAFAFVELRMLWRFLVNRTAIRQAVAGSQEGASRPRNLPPPTVTIQIPLYNERTTAEQIIRAAAAQDYPADRFDIQVLDDSTDETQEIVARVVDEVRRGGIRIEHLHRTDRKGYKAGALAAGLEHSDAEFLALFDADFVPEPDFLTRLLVEDRAFEDPKVAFVQARWAWSGPVRDLFSAALALLIDRHFFVQKPTRAFLGEVTTFNGSAGIWRRRAVDEAGGWSAETLTEDLDLSYRCALRGWRGAYVHGVAVPNEVPGHMRAFKMQQHRWAKGNAQCFRSLTGRVMASKGVLRDRVDEAFLLAGYAIHPILLANVLLWPWAVLSMDRTLFLVLQAFMGLAILVAPLSFVITVVERDGGWSFCRGRWRVRPHAQVQQAADAAGRCGLADRQSLRQPPALDVLRRAPRRRILPGRDRGASHAGRGAMGDSAAVLGDVSGPRGAAPDDAPLGLRRRGQQ